jgi:hypothetical protein
MGARTQASAAAVLDVSIPTLRRVLADEAVRPSIRARIGEKIGQRA